MLDAVPKAIQQVNCTGNLNWGGNIIIEEVKFLVRLLGPLLKIVFSLMKNVLEPLAKSVLIPLGLTAVASVADTGIDKKGIRTGHDKSNNFKLRNGWHPENI